jgi:hypothetical protein
VLGPLHAPQPRRAAVRSRDRVGRRAFWLFTLPSPPATMQASGSL